MKTQILSVILISSALFAAPAFADGNQSATQIVAAPSAIVPAATGLTRAQVKAELVNAEKDGEFAAINDDDSYPQDLLKLERANAAKSRAQALAKAKVQGSFSSMSDQDQYPITAATVKNAQPDPRG